MRTALLSENFSNTIRDKLLKKGVCFKILNFKLNTRMQLRELYFSFYRSILPTTISSALV